MFMNRRNTYLQYLQISQFQIHLHWEYIGCPTRYRTRHEEIATKFEQEYVRCVRNEQECVCSVCLQCVSVVRQIVATGNSGPPAGQANY